MKDKQILLERKIEEGLPDRAYCLSNKFVVLVLRSKEL